MTEEEFTDIEPNEDAEKWRQAFAAQSRKLQHVLHIPGVREALAELKWANPIPDDYCRERLPMADEEFTDIEVEARRRMAWHSRGTRGQVVRPQDMLDWWIAQVAYERGREDKLHEPE